MINTQKNKTDYVRFPKGKQTEFLRKVKVNLSLTWIKIAKSMNVSRSMIYFYLDESSKMPYSSFLHLCNLANLNQDKFEIDRFCIISKGEAIIPTKLTPKLAEFVGFMLGDGHISPINYQICVSVDGLLDKEYVNKVIKDYFMYLFKKEPAIYYSKTKRNVRCFIYSKKVFNYLTVKLGLPSGRKKYRSNNKIPEVFFNNKLLLIKVLRGLFDTEGGFYQHNKTSPRLYIYNTSKPLLESIHLALLQLNYKSIKKEKWIKICRKGEIRKFFNEIGTSNLQKQLKYQIWLKEGKVPKNDRIIEELKRL